MLAGDDWENRPGAPRPRGGIAIAFRNRRRLAAARPSASERPSIMGTKILEGRPALFFMSSLISPRWLLWALVGAGFVSLRAGEESELSHAEAELAKKFAGVAQWQGIYEVSVIGAATTSGANGYHLESRYEASGHGTFLLERSSDDEPAAGLFRWVGKGEVKGGGMGTFSEWDQHGVGEEWSQEFSGAVGQERIEFSLGLKNKSAQLHAGLQRGEPLMRRTGRMVSAQGSGNQVSAIDTTFPAPIDVWSLGGSQADQARRWQAVSNGPGVLSFTHEGPAAGRSQKFYVSGAGVIRRSKVILFPVYEDLEVEVAITDYAQWRPMGSIADPKKPGNALVARATLKSKSGQAAEFPPIKEFRFELMDTSREPGVCLNWPLGAKDEDYDLRLATAGTGGDLSGGGQKLSVTDAPLDDQRRPYAEATVECFDFGARGELRVICELEDGRELIGLMKGEGGDQDIVRLPKMQGPDWIAELWRREKDVMKLAAGDDAEQVEGQKDDGDGFTLYEEYRGWAVNGRHVEGDPKRKDFFVLDLGADAQPGVALFAALSKLRVHSKLRRSEMSQTARLMNGNHRDAPHRVNQHGVWVKNFTREKLGDNGADTPMTKAGVAGRPGITKGVGILARNDAASIFNKPFNLPARDTIFAYDRAVAHELLHSVGVEHHGSGDYQQILGYVSPRNPANKVGRPYYASSPNAAPTVVLDEAGHDLATKNYVDYVKMREFADAAMLERELAEGRAYLERNGVGWNGIKTPQQYADTNIETLIVFCFMHLDGVVGVARGEHSGNQDCLMRYYFAKFYEAAGRKDTLYVATPGTERIGIDLCHSPAGTGINSPGHKPQSRYGNAAEGDCFSQICPNDAIPPRKLKQ